MSDVIVTRDVLDIYDKYGGDFGLLDERWASKEDRDKVTPEQTMLLSEYMDKLSLLMVQGVSAEIKKTARIRAVELETVIDKDVVEIIKQRLARRPD